MTGITDPTEEYFKDGLWAWVTNQWKKLVADASNFLQINIAAQDIDVEVKQTNAADLTPGVKGWDGSTWRKLPMMWGYSAIYMDNKEDVDADAGVNTLSGTHVPAGEVWIVEGMQARNDDTDPSTVTLQAYIDTKSFVAQSETNPGVAVWTYWTGAIRLGADDYVQADFAGCTALDHIRFRARGYKMKIAE